MGLFAGHMNTLDVRALLQDDAIDNVEMSEAAAEETDDNSDIKSNLSQNGDEDEVRMFRRRCENNNYHTKY